MTLVPCLPCGGAGLVDRPVQEAMAHGDWHAHLFAKALCNSCGGGGKVPLNPKTVKES